MKTRRAGKTLRKIPKKLHKMFVAEVVSGKESKLHNQNETMKIRAEVNWGQSDSKSCIGNVFVILRDFTFSRTELQICNFNFMSEKIFGEITRKLHAEKFALNEATSRVSDGRETAKLIPQKSRARVSF